MQANVKTHIFISLSSSGYPPVDNASMDQVVVLVTAQSVLVNTESKKIIFI